MFSQAKRAYFKRLGLSEARIKQLEAAEPKSKERSADAAKFEDTIYKNLVAAMDRPSTKSTDDVLADLKALRVGLEAAAQVRKEQRAVDGPTPIGFINAMIVESYQPAVKSGPSAPGLLNSLMGNGRVH